MEKSYQRFIDRQPWFIGFRLPEVDLGCTWPAIGCIFASSTTKNRKTMNAKSIIIAAVLTVSSGILFAGNENSSSPVKFESNSIITMNFAPSTPAEATFEEVEVMNDFAFLAPSMPNEADFDDVTTDMSIDIIDLAPVAPVVADFNDSSDVAIDVSALSPVTPIVADFE